MSLEPRLQLLAESGQISPLVAELTREVMRKVEAAYHIELTEENGAMFVTHLAVALERLRTGQAISEMPEAALAEVKAYTREWQFMSEVARETAERLHVQVPEGEVGFLTAHLATLVHGGDQV
ncbi:MAG: putative transcriptional antiterminator [Firmicutes bacterium]|nr:putative transcriptional antiterminator [Bacillota bacterium]